MADAPEWLRLLRGWPAYLIIMYTPFDRWRWSRALITWPLLPYAGDWAYRHDRREARR